MFRGPQKYFNILPYLSYADRVVNILFFFFLMVEEGLQKQIYLRFTEVIMWSCSAYISFIFSGPYYEIVKVDCGLDC